MLLLHYPETATEEEKAEQRRFAGKFQQVTAPVMAKGVEDTAFYIYNRLASLNEVGGDPSQFGAPPDDLHRFFQERQAQWPFSLSPLATHDTKRGEDVRARLNVLSEIPDEWRERLIKWRVLNEHHRIQVEDDLAPDMNEQYLLYQTLIGAWPFGGWSAEEHEQFVSRIQEYMLKAIHEAKVHTSWINPNKGYDDAVQEFVERILDEKAGGPFLEDFRPFQRRISHYGLFNSLSQTLLRIAAPGAPDTYQGTELWDFHLVDPDNRQPVDYARRREMLGELKKRIEGDGDNLCGLARELVESREDGRIKLYVTHRALQTRREHPGLFADGAYTPLEVEGPRKDHAFAFARQKEGRWAVVVVPRLMTQLAPGPDQLPIGAVWEGTTLHLPQTESVKGWRNVFTGQRLVGTENSRLALLEVFAHFPLALLVAGIGKPRRAAERILALRCASRLTAKTLAYANLARLHQPDRLATHPQESFQPAQLRRQFRRLAQQRQQLHHRRPRLGFGVHQHIDKAARLRQNQQFEVFILAYAGCLLRGRNGVVKVAELVHQAVFFRLPAGPDAAARDGFELLARDLHAGLRPSRHRFVQELVIGVVNQRGHRLLFGGTKGERRREDAGVGAAAITSV